MASTEVIINVKFLHYTSRIVFLTLQHSYITVFLHYKSRIVILTLQKQDCDSYITAAGLFLTLQHSCIRAAGFFVILTSQYSYITAAGLCFFTLQHSYITAAGLH